MLSDAAPSELDASGLDSEVPETKTLSLTPEQMTALSLSDPKPGQIINIQLEYGSSPPPGGDEASGTVPAEGDTEAAPVDAAAPKMFTVISSTTETQEEGPNPDDALPGNDDESPEQKTLGFKRPTKAPRQGLPSPMNMRSF